MSKMIGVIGKTGRTLRNVAKPTKIFKGLPAKLSKGGVCHVCDSEMTMKVGLKNGKPFHFYTCAKCNKSYHYQ